MFFRVQNLGPLRDAEVDLSKDLIVLAGPNNSGKTYLAWSVYGLHRMRPEPKVDLTAWARKLVESPEHLIYLNELFAQEGQKVIEDMARQFQDKLHLCFASEKSLFVGAEVTLRNLQNPFHHLMRHYSRGPTSLWGNEPRWVVRWRPEVPTHIECHITTSKDADVVAAPNVFGPSFTETTSNIALIPMEQIGAFLARRFPEAGLPRCTLFPAERIAVNIFAKELALSRTKLVDEMIDADLEGQIDTSMELVRRSAGRYPWPIRDSLRTANDISNLSKNTSPFAHLADELEIAILGGRVSVSDNGELLFVPRGADKARLQMHLTASVVKSLSSLVFYFRHLAQPGDFIIIDEPELNLHPDNQRKITRILAKAVRLGFKIMMSTHSDYVLRELNHLIMLNTLPEDEAKALGYDPEFAIDPNRIGVYLFNEGTAQPVPIGETGFFIKTIDDVVNQLNVDEQRLYTRIFKD